MCKISLRGQLRTIQVVTTSDPTTSKIEQALAQKYPNSFCQNTKGRGQTWLMGMPNWYRDERRYVCQLVLVTAARRVRLRRWGKNRLIRARALDDWAFTVPEAIPRTFAVSRIDRPSTSRS
jgi:hypothetical protein